MAVVPLFVQRIKVVAGQSEKGFLKMSRGALVFVLIWGEYKTIYYNFSSGYYRYIS